MRARPTLSALAALAAAVTIAGAPAYAAPASAVPPAPAPTDHGRSPAAPDPHPPRGGIGPDKEAVGGARLLGRGLVLPPHAPSLPQHLTATSWIVVDLDAATVLAARDPHGRYQPASIQKLLTAVTLLPLLPGNRRVTVSGRAAATEGSHAGLVAGGSYTVDDVFRGLLLVSGNDCAEALAEAAGGRAATVTRMNALAARLGAYDTVVQTPSGLDGWQQLTSAYDMALFLRAALAMPRFAAYDTTRAAVLPAQPARHTGAVRLVNQNIPFLTTVSGALVAKTGYTDAAQHTFAGAITEHGHRYGVVLLRAQRSPDDQWVQATALVRWAAALRSGTPAVGRLDAAVRSAPAVRATVTPAAATPTPTQAATPTPSPPPGRHGIGSGGALGGLVLLLLIGVVVLFAARIRRER